ncbi:MAG: indolepyruvate ferredoxin oxidoreductase subunit alpha [Desulfobacteraceae bacterium]|nr:indolepyruvate ferredoxin oxidoreductase subunit alpha [Desulfobacteraceae bacterium]
MHKLLNDSPGEEIMLLGNESIARGAIEAGVAFATTYPGTPSSEISLNLWQMSQETDLYFEYSTNEKVALEVAAAAAISGVRTMCMMKHVGLNVAADPLMTLAYIGIKGGLVILTADDPYMFSSQNEQDNRYYGKLGGLPVLEPSSVREAKEMTKYAFELSEKVGEPVLLRTTTRINHSSAFVDLGKMEKRAPKGDFNREPMSYVTVPAVARNLHVKLLENLDKTLAIAENCKENFIEGDGKLGIVCNGVSYSYVADAVKDLGLEGKAKTLRIGLSNPLPGKLIKQFISSCEKVLIVEEGEPFMEEAVKAFAQEEGITIPIAGKSEELFSRLYEYNPGIVRENMATFFGFDYTPATNIDSSNFPEIPQRPPNLCSGCSHRATFYELQQAAKDMDMIVPTDIGCYTLGFLPPLNTGDIAICMGASISSACGFAEVTDKKVVPVIGDSTFFHSGMTGLVNAVFNNHDLTLVILENGITAMTGHQPHPGVDMDQLNFKGYNRISIEQVVRSMGVEHVTIVKPFKVKKSIQQIKEAIEFKGVSVIISQEPCAIMLKNLKTKTLRPFKITDKCNNTRDCVNTIACPSFFIEGDKVNIDATTCVGCAVCAQICPENAIIPLKN